MRGVVAPRPTPNLLGRGLLSAPARIPPLGPMWSLISRASLASGPASVRLHLSEILSGGDLTMTNLPPPEPSRESAVPVDWVKFWGQPVGVSYSSESPLSWFLLDDPQGSVLSAGPPGRSDKPHGTPSFEVQFPASAPGGPRPTVKLVNTRMDALLSQALRDQTAADQAIFAYHLKERRFRSAFRRLHKWVHEHPPGWGAVVAGILASVIGTLGSLFGQSSPPPRPIQPPAIIRESGEPPTPYPTFPNRITGTEPNPEVLKPFVTGLSVHQRAELVVGTLPVTEDVAWELLALTPRQLMGLAVDGLSEQQVPAFKQDLYTEIEAIVPPDQQA